METREPDRRAGTFARLLHTGAAAVSLLIPTLKVSAAEPAPAPAAHPADEQGDHATRDKLEKQFAELMTGATMVGRYTVEGSDAAPKEDRYRITKAVKADGDNWVITSSIEYKGFAIPVSLTLPVKWAGDTPVIEVTDQKIPGLGTFTARVLFHGDRYVGTWDGGNGHAGTLWGRIEHEGPAQGKGETKGATTQPEK